MDRVPVIDGRRTHTRRQRRDRGVLRRSLRGPPPAQGVHAVPFAGRLAPGRGQGAQEGDADLTRELDGVHRRGRHRRRGALPHRGLGVRPDPGLRLGVRAGPGLQQLVPRQVRAHEPAPQGGGAAAGARRAAGSGRVAPRGDGAGNGSRPAARGQRAPQGVRTPGLPPPLRGGATPGLPAGHPRRPEPGAGVRLPEDHVHDPHPGAPHRPDDPARQHGARRRVRALPRPAGGLPGSRRPAGCRT